MRSSSGSVVTTSTSVPGVLVVFSSFSWVVVGSALVPKEVVPWVEAEVVCVPTLRTKSGCSVVTEGTAVVLSVVASVTVVGSVCFSEVMELVFGALLEDEAVDASVGFSVVLSAAVVVVVGSSIFPAAVTGELTLVVASVSVSGVVDDKPSGLPLVKVGVTGETVEVVDDCSTDVVDETVVAPSVVLVAPVKTKSGC